MLITVDHLNAVRDSFVARKSRIDLENLITAHSQRTARYSEISVFLSHKHDEITPLRNAIALLNSCGVDVYVDWFDDTMPPNTNGQTAERLKSKIKVCKKFILLATPGAINSKWCNWELGIGDVFKYSSHIALMPIATNDSSWPGNEYLQIYPAVMTDYQSLVGYYYVEFKGKRTELSEWLKS